MFIPQVTNIHSKFQLDTMSGSAKTRSKYFSQCYSNGEFWQVYPPFWTPPNLKSELLRLFMACFTIVGHPNFQTATLYDVGKWVRIYVSESVSHSWSFILYRLGGTPARFACQPRCSLRSHSGHLGLRPRCLCCIFLRRANSLRSFALLGLRPRTFFSHSGRSKLASLV